MPLGSGSFSLVTPFSFFRLSCFWRAYSSPAFWRCVRERAVPQSRQNWWRHGASWIAVCVYAAVWIPRARKILQDFGIELSSLSMLVIQIADLMADPVVIVIMTASLLAADGVIYSLLWRSDISPSTRKWFSVLMTLIPLFVMLLFGTAIVVPLFRLMA